MTCAVARASRNIRVNGDPTAPITSIQTFLSPTGVLGPRIIRFNVTYQFGGF